jgi:hypothetical protein
MRIVGGEIFSEVEEEDISKILDRLEALGGLRPRSERPDDGKIIFPGS